MTSAGLQIVYAREDLIPSFHKSLDRVARERVHLEMTEAPPLDKVLGFQRELIANSWPGFYAVSGEDVVGWADAFPARNPRLAHRAFLGMGIIPEYRGQGLGTRLLDAVLGHARKIGLEKIELTCYAQNAPALALYKKCGFTEIGVIRHYRKLDDRYFDAVEMELFL